jgi:hypothetical protein
MHFREEYIVVAHRPKKIKEVNEYLWNDMIETETKVLRNGKWRIFIKREKAHGE